MSESSGTPAGPAATAATPAADGSAAAPTPSVGTRRAAPGLSHQRAGMSLSQGVAALRRGASPAPAATPAATGGDGATAAAEATPAAPQRRPAATRRAPFAIAADPAADDGAGDGGQQQQRQPRQRTAATEGTASPLDAIMSAFMPGDGTAAPTPQRTAAEPQPAPVNAYLQGVPIRIGNEERNFTVPELTEAVSKAHDYTRKTAALAEQQRALAERTQTIDQLLPILIPEIERQLEALNGGAQEPDWIALAGDPAEYARQHATWQVRRQKGETERGRLAQIMQANQQREQQIRADRVRVSHAQLVRTLPGWADANTRNQLVSEMRAWGGQQGFPAAELDSIVEARHVETMVKAMLFDRLRSGARTNTLTVPQVRRGGAPPPPAPAALQRAEERFNAQPNNKTGVGLLMARRSQGRANGRG